MGAGRRGVFVYDAGLVVDEGGAEREVEEDGGGEEDAFDGEGPCGGGMVAGGDGEEADEAALGEVDARDELAESALVGLALGVDVGFVAVEEVVAEGDVDQGEADGGEAEDKGRDARVAERDDAQVDPFGEFGAPHGRGEVDELLPDLAGGLAREDAA